MLIAVYLRYDERRYVLMTESNLHFMKLLARARAYVMLTRSPETLFDFCVNFFSAFALPFLFFFFAGRTLSLECRFSLSIFFLSMHQHRRRKLCLFAEDEQANKWNNTEWKKNVQSVSDLRLSLLLRLMLRRRCTDTAISNQWNTQPAIRWVLCMRCIRA